MQIQVFCIPLEGDPEAVEPLNQFLRTHKILRVEKVPVTQDGRSFWSVYVEYLESRPALRGPAVSSTGSAKARVDYREILGDVEFQRFSKLRELRKQLADKEGVPVYALFTNAQLAEAARENPHSRAALKKGENAIVLQYELTKRS